MRRFPNLSIAAFSIALLMSCLPASAQLRVTGGSAAERQEIASVLRHQLSGLVLPQPSVNVQIVTRTEMASMVHDDTDAHDRSDSSQPVGTSSASQEGGIDGIYDDGSDRKDGQAIITLQSGERKAEFDATFAHEYGHHVWTAFMLSGERDEYSKAYARSLTGHHLITDYAEESPEEGFAESFSYYVLQPKLLLNRDPEAYHFIEALVPRLRAACAALSDDDVNHAGQS